MKIGNKVVVNSDSKIISEFNGVSGTIIKEHVSDSHAAMMSGKSKWIVEFDVPVVIRGETIATCAFKESELELVDDVVYEVVAYDKDEDYEVSLLKTNDYGDARAHALKFGEQCRLDLLLNPENGQPFDWVKLVNADDWDVVYWTSYGR